MVLAVLSLLTGIVLSGTTIINNAKAVNTIKEITTYQEAIYKFYQTYGAIPGDYGEAQYKLSPSGYSTKSWSEIDSTMISTIPHNGQQDGKVSNRIIIEDGVSYSEVFGVWNHLSSSGLIGKNFSNICFNKSSTEITNCAKGGYNLPIISSGLGSSSVYIFYAPDIDNKDDYELIQQLSEKNTLENSHVLLMTDISHHLTYSNTMIDGSYILGGGGGINSSLMLKIDLKIDDGKPLTGNVFGLNASNEDNKNNLNIKVGQCNTYKGNIYTNNGGDNSVDREKIYYTNDTEKTCLGAVLFKNF